MELHYQKPKKQIVRQRRSDIQLTIDKTIQNLVEDAMNEVDKEYSPEKMLVIVANPKTGAILAMSQRPAFDPTTRVGLTANWLNEAVENTIEPGSTMKIFTLAAAIEEKNGIQMHTFNLVNIHFTTEQFEIITELVGERFHFLKDFNALQTFRWHIY